VRLLPAVVGLVVMLAGCVSPAWDDHDYGLKAAATAQSVASAVAISRRAVDGRARLTGRYMEVLLTDTVTDVRNAEQQFAGVQPPGPASDRIKNDVLALTGRAEDVLDRLLVQVRRGHITDPEGAVQDLRRLGAELLRFQQEHQ
jgi:hypothetical protein